MNDVYDTNLYMYDVDKKELNEVNNELLII